MQNISPPVAAYGLRFRGRNKIDDSLQFINLNIFSKVKNPYVLGQIPYEKVYYMNDKYEIVNIMNQQPFQQKIDNILVTYKRPVITKNLIHYYTLLMKLLIAKIKKFLYKVCTLHSQHQNFIKNIN